MCTSCWGGHTLSSWADHMHDLVVWKTHAELHISTGVPQWQVHRVQHDWIMSSPCLCSCHWLPSKLGAYHSVPACQAGKRLVSLRCNDVDVCLHLVQWRGSVGITARHSRSRWSSETGRRVQSCGKQAEATATTSLASCSACVSACCPQCGLSSSAANGVIAADDESFECASSSAIAATQAKPTDYGQDCPGCADCGARCKTPAQAGSTIRGHWSANSHSRCGARWRWAAGSRADSQCHCDCCRRHSGSTSGSWPGGGGDSRSRQSVQSVACQPSCPALRARCSASSQRQRRATAAHSGPLARPNQSQPPEIQQRRQVGRVVLWRVRKVKLDGHTEGEVMPTIQTASLQVATTHASAAMASLDHLGSSTQYQRGRSSGGRARRCSGSAVRRCKWHCRRCSTWRGSRRATSRCCRRTLGSTSRCCRRTLGSMGSTASASRREPSSDRRRCSRPASSLQYPGTASPAETQVGTQTFASSACQHKEQATAWDAPIQQPSFECDEAHTTNSILAWRLGRRGRATCRQRAQFVLR